MKLCITAAAVFGPAGFTDLPLERPGRVDDLLLSESLALRGLRPLSRTARLAMAVAARVLPPASATGPGDAVVLGSSRSSVAPLAEFVQVAAELGANQVFPMAFPNTVVSVHAGYVATLLGCSGPVLAPCGEHTGLEAMVEACALLEGGRADRVLAIGADAAEPTVLAAAPDAAEGAASILVSGHPDSDGCLAEITHWWSGSGYADLPGDVRPDCPADGSLGYGAAHGASMVAAAALAVAAAGRPRTVVGRCGVRGVAAFRLEPVAG